MVRYMGLRLNFSWVEKNVIAGAHYPNDSSDFDYLRKNGIKVIICLRQNYHYQDLQGFMIYHLPIEDFSIPSDEHVREFWQICQKHEKYSRTFRSPYIQERCSAVNRSYPKVGWRKIG